MVRRKWLVLLNACVVAGGLLAAGVATASPGGRPALVRLAGPDRYGTAATVSAANFAPGVAVAYLATGLKFPDALAGAAAAGGQGPVLLAQPDALPTVTANELRRLAPKRLVALGGLPSLSDATVAAAQAAAGGVSTTRLAGPDRYGTAAKVSAATFAPGVAVAYLANGMTFWDALAGSAVAGSPAANEHGPVLLASPDGLPSATANELARLAPKRLVVLGTTTLVSDATAAAAQSAAHGVAMTRLSGNGPAWASAVISSASFSAPAGVVYIASGEEFADALAGAAVAAGHGPILMVTATTLPDVVAAELRRLHAARTIILGGTPSVSDAVANMADRITAGGIPSQRSSAPTAVSAARAELGKTYVWGGAGPDGFDCSGLTAWAWKAAGVALPHNAAAQDDAVADIPVAAAQPGDLLFYGSPDVYHVAIYVGNGQMIEAAHSGVPVRLTPVRNGDLENAGRIT